jgi:predicted HAD superfamily hydrolase/SAM-dependent methyltransferase
MNFTGERFTPRLHDPAVSYEHWHRYQFAGLFVNDKRVLDIASGEGYGSNLLSQNAKSVVGVDISRESVNRASSVYVRDNLTFLVGSATHVPIDQDHSFDVIVSFETLEHLDDEQQRAFLAEVKRLLSPDGVFIVSTPNKAVSTDSHRLKNDCRANDFYYSEFKGFLEEKFANLVMLGQKVETGSRINCFTGSPNTSRQFFIRHSESGFHPAEDGQTAEYFLAVCSDASLANVPSSFCTDLSARMVASRDERIAGLERSIQAISEQMIKRDETIETLTARLAECDESISARVAQRDQTIQSLATQMAAINNSRLWRIVLWLRKIRVLLVPPKSRRSAALRQAASLALTPYRRLKGVKTPKKIAAPPKAAGKKTAPPVSEPPLRGAKSRYLVNIENVAPRDLLPGRIAVHVHVFHPDAAAEFANYFCNMPFPYDLYVSVLDKNARDVCSQAFSGLPLCTKIAIEIVPNRGRDIAPMFCAFGKALMNYDFVAHLHGRKSGGNNGPAPSWREYLCKALFGSERRIKQISALLANDYRAGIVYPQTHGDMPAWANTWLANRHAGAAWCKRLGIDRVPRGYFDYPLGSMFWARVDALHPLFAAQIAWDDFAPESGQPDGTPAHCIEQLPVLVARQQGFNHAIIEDSDSPSWSAWRLDRYFERTSEPIVDRFNSPDIRAVAFDIFDTLLCRPLLNPEGTKEIVVQRAAGRLAELFRDFRAKAEAAARLAAGRDVGLDQIYAEFVKQTGASQEEADSLRRLEEQVEWHAVSPRADGVSLLQAARNAGKRVILLSDMFLPKNFIEALLKEHGITAWDALYLSSDVGLRKDGGGLYKHALERERLAPSQLLMIGDNERSDVQIPSDMGIATYHVLRPIEAARALPRLAPLVEKVEAGKDINDQLTLGLLLRRAYSPVFYEAFDPASLFPAAFPTMGYCIVGPLVLGFVHWLIERARQDKIDRLHFLAREGKAIKLVYDRWVQAVGGGPPSDYLVLSRRAVTVPAIDNHEQILGIARTDYAANTARCFLEERFGLMLSKNRWDEIQQRCGWTPERQVMVAKGQIGNEVLKLLFAVQEDILAQVADERPAVLAYLHDMGFDNGQRAAIVDVGYSATAQDRVCLLTGQRVHGYYMVTLEKAHDVANRYDCIVRGCFAEALHSHQTAMPMYRNGITIEKMLGADEGQIVRYTIHNGGSAVGVHRPLSKAERQGSQARAQIREGMMQYVEDAINLRTNLFPNFQPPLLLPEEVFSAFIAALSPPEKLAMHSLILDDFYCGHGLV